MRVNRTYSLDYDTIRDLNNAISAKHRSQFVDKAIKNRIDLLFGDAEIDVTALSSRRLMAILLNREDCSEFVKKVLQAELTQ